MVPGLRVARDLEPRSAVASGDDSGVLELASRAAGGAHLEQLDLRRPCGVHPAETLAHRAHLGDDGLAMTTQAAEAGKGEELPAASSLLHIVSLSVRTVPYQWVS
jgi:hypothetical protein